jgi:hypothetical protein
MTALAITSICLFDLKRNGRLHQQHKLCVNTKVSYVCLFYSQWDALLCNLVLISDITHICVIRFQSLFNKDQFHKRWKC